MTSCHSVLALVVALGSAHVVTFSTAIHHVSEPAHERMPIVCLIRLILPAVTMLVIGFGYTLFAGKTKEQRASSTQIKLLRKAVQETMLAKGVGADRVAEYMKDYWKLTNSLDYDADIQQRFSTLCQVAGVAGEGAFVDQRLL